MNCTDHSTDQVVRGPGTGIACVVKIYSLRSDQNRWKLPKCYASVNSFVFPLWFPAVCGSGLTRKRCIRRAWETRHFEGLVSFSYHICVLRMSRDTNKFESFRHEKHLSDKATRRQSWIRRERDLAEGDSMHRLAWLLQIGLHIQ